MKPPDDPIDDADERASASDGARRPATVGGQHRRDADLNRHGGQSADESGVEGEGAGAAELDAEIARRASGATHGQPGPGLGAGLTQRPPD